MSLSLFSFSFAVFIAVLLDLAFGDPRWIPHPVKLMGKLDVILENWTRQQISNDYLAGFAATILLLLIVVLSTLVITCCCLSCCPFFSFVASTMLLYSSIACNDMISHSKNVYRALVTPRILKKYGFDEARRRVGMIVGRDTGELTEEEISRACIESVAENMVDGITAPLFWAFIGALIVNIYGYQADYVWGALGAMMYKAVNTMDSMFGYKNSRYLNFGKTAAWLDDFANYIPARLSACIMVLTCPLLGHTIKRTWIVYKRDRGKHASPNSGQSEAAMAGALHVTLGGGGFYFGKYVKKPILGDPHQPAKPSHILEANRLLLVTSLFFLLFLYAVHFFTCF